MAHLPQMTGFTDWAPRSVQRLLCQCALKGPHKTNKKVLSTTVLVSHAGFHFSPIIWRNNLKDHEGQAVHEASRFHRNGCYFFHVSYFIYSGPEICSSHIKFYQISDFRLHLCWDSMVLEALFCQVPSWTRVWLVLQASLDFHTFFFLCSCF